jgi:hypothetical protein
LCIEKYGNIVGGVDVLGIVSDSHEIGGGDSRVFYVKGKNLLVTYRVCVKFFRCNLKFVIVALFVIIVL